MSLLLTAHKLSKSFSHHNLFKGISFTLNAGDRVGLIGPNGAGKSTLLKMVAGLEPADEGLITKRSGLRIGFASQSPEFASISVQQVLLSEALLGPCMDESEAILRADQLLSRAHFSSPDLLASTLSGGWKKRLDLCRALMLEPEILLLDEPTNHLDIEGILWLEKFLEKEKASCLIVSHDRYFLKRVCQSTMELNRCYAQGLLRLECDFDSFIEAKQQFLKGQQETERSLANSAQAELNWLQTSPKARTSKSKARIKEAHELFDEFKRVQLRNKKERVNLEFQASERQTRNLIVASNLSMVLGQRELFNKLDLRLSPGLRLGVVGQNASGKTTLLKILAGELQATSGTIKYADDLQLVYFDQHREQLPLEQTLHEVLGEGCETVNWRGQTIHVAGWAKRFLFSRDRLDMPIKYLSGGERARIQIAKLMLKPADVLFLDEPTNDLDIATLEVIEQNLKEFPGAIVMISHDRALMDRVCTQILALGQTHERSLTCYYEDYLQWERALVKSLKQTPCRTQEKKTATTSPDKTSTKLSGKEKFELINMEKEILLLESELESTMQAIADLEPASIRARELYELAAAKQLKLDEKYERWQQLLSRQETH